ncbi:MAG: hypothetical protein KKF33_09555, partial [Alphaproteobacteria bacterium]|nr:hypothetical protein [Alphaproteobacteria bacterium]
PTVLIVDLKSHSGANLEFVESVQGLLKGKGIAVLVLAAEAGKEARNALLNAGAAKVFVRHANVEAYTDVAADMVEFCSLAQRAEAVGM